MRGNSQKEYILQLLSVQAQLWPQHLKQYLKYILSKKVAKPLTSVYGLDKNTD